MLDPTSLSKLGSNRVQNEFLIGMKAASSSRGSVG